VLFRSYDEFIPDGISGWNSEMVAAKCSNIAKVISDMDADVVALEEIESLKALAMLKAELKSQGANFPYHAMAETGNHAVGCALISKYPVISKKNIPVDKGYKRNILKAVIDINGRKLNIYVNHWSSKKSPESERMASAKVLKKSISNDFRTSGRDFIVIGDFNSDYDEFRTLLQETGLNDTNGLTGINHILETVADGALIDKKKLLTDRSAFYLYNLWLELPSEQRWSYSFSGQRCTLDNMLIPSALYDGRGLDYKDQSFKRFAPDYLFLKKSVFRWQMTRGGRGRHLGKGYSDHLPIYADFTVH
jgi:endonuclease/exonuclease/phosphatase family metal-dependent hydrolase